MKNGSTWTAANVPNLRGRVVVVTGANSGIGFEAARVFAHERAHTILACRNTVAGEEARERLARMEPEGSTEVLPIDLANLESVQGFADEFTRRHDRLDVLVNNAGVTFIPHERTVDGFERQFGTNHLGHFALTGRLFGRLASTPGARVVTVTSPAERGGTMDFDDLMYDRGGYATMRAYGRSKLANLLFTHELHRRVTQADLDTLSLAAHPGVAATNMGRRLEEKWYGRLLSPIHGLIAQSATMGALSTLRAATDPRVTSGEYYGPDGFRQMRGYPVRVESSPASHDPDTARRLWVVSEKLTGVRFPI